MTISSGGNGRLPPRFSHPPVRERVRRPASVRFTGHIALSILLKCLGSVKHVTQGVVASYQEQCHCGSDDIACEKLSPGEVSKPDVRKHRRHYDGGRLEKNSAEDYPEHDRRLFHRCVQGADNRESVGETQREMDKGESRDATEKLNGLKRFASYEIETGEPEPCRHADDQSEASAFARGAVSPRRVTCRGRARYNVNVFHDNMNRRSANVVQ